MQVYQLPMESSSSFAGLLEALEQRGSALGRTHHAISMPTLEEVFLACTAEPPAAEQAALQPNLRADAYAQARGAAARGHPPSSDGSCVIQMSDLRGGAAQGATGAQKQAAGSDSSSQDNPLSLQHDSSTAEASEHQNADAERSERRKTSRSGGSSAGPAARPEAEATSDIGYASDSSQHDVRQPPLPISRDDSAQMLSEEVSHSSDHAKSQTEAESLPGHILSESVPGSSSHSHKGLPLASTGLQTGEPRYQLYLHAHPRSAPNVLF